MVGLVRGVHGLNGALKVEILTDHPEARFARGMVLFREGTDAGLTVLDAAPIVDGPGWRIRFQEIPDRTAADALRGTYLEGAVPPGDGPGRGAAYWHEVIGTAVVGLDGERLGSVADIYRVADNDVYVVRGGPRGEFDVPAVRDFIRIFAPRRGEIVVDAVALDVGPVRPLKPPRPPRPRKGEARRSAGPLADPPATADVQPTADPPAAAAEPPVDPARPPADTDVEA